MKRPDLAALAFCGLVVVGVVVLSALHVPVPDFLPAVGMFVAGGAAGVALNTAPAPARENLRPASLEEAPPAANLAAQRRPPVPLTSEPATATFARVARHEP